MANGGHKLLPWGSLSIPNLSYFTFLSQCDVQTCWKGVWWDLLGALEAPALQALAASGVPDVCPSSASLGEIPSLLRVRYKIQQISTESYLLYSYPWAN